MYVSQALVEGDTEIQGKQNSLISQGSSHHTCFVIYPQRMNNLVAIYLKKVFLLYKFKVYNYFPPSDIPSNNENNKFN